MLGKWFKSLLGGSSSDDGSASGQGGPADTAATIEYQGFSIEAAPIPEGGQFRTAGFISGDNDGESKRIQFIRADTTGDRDSAIEHSLAKGKQIVDEQGKALLKRDYL
ncbi:MAG: hypothetical protein KTR32_14615 [Granulosicoccus sp.]|nr:hypothetical protein [Granulosicoccus sp.]